MTERTEVELLLFADTDEWVIAVVESDEIEVWARGFETALAAANHANALGWRVVLNREESTQRGDGAR